MGQKGGDLRWSVLVNALPITVVLDKLQAELSLA